MCVHFEHLRYTTQFFKKRAIDTLIPPIHMVPAADCVAMVPRTQGRRIQRRNQASLSITGRKTHIRVIAVPEHPVISIVMNLTMESSEDDGHATLMLRPGLDWGYESVLAL